MSGTAYIIWENRDSRWPTLYAALEPQLVLPDCEKVGFPNGFRFICLTVDTAERAKLWPLADIEQEPNPHTLGVLSRWSPKFFEDKNGCMMEPYPCSITPEIMDKNLRRLLKDLGYQNFVGTGGYVPGLGSMYTAPAGAELLFKL